MAAERGTHNLAPGIVAANLRVDAVTAEILRGFDEAGIESLLLKGPSVARWLYDNEDPRGYADSDLLVQPAHFERAEELLAGLGFAPIVDRHEMPDWWQDPSIEWIRTEDGAVVDLHSSLAGVAAPPELVWRTLAEDREPIAVAGFAAQTLAIPARALMLALHAAHHGVGWGRFLDDLERGVATVPMETWRAAAELAAVLDATPAFASGLRLVEPGRALAVALGLPEAGAVGLALQATTPPPIALGFDQLAQARGLRRRLAILRHKFFPPVTFMRRWSQLARRGPRGLVLAYFQRWWWLLRHAPAGFRAWRSARRKLPRSADQS